jgi:hypothetical protein
MRTLERFDLVAESGQEQVRGAIKHYYRSLIGSNKLVQSVLQATDQTDQQRFSSVGT